MRRVDNMFPYPSRAQHRAARRCGRVLDGSSIMATMDEKRPGGTPEGGQAPASDAARGERRRRAHEILATQRSSLDQLENQISEGLRQLADEVARELSNREAEFAAAAQSDAQTNE